MFFCRGSALVELLVGSEAHLSLPPAHTAWLEVWTANAPLPMSANVTSSGQSCVNQILGQLHISIQAFSDVNPGKICSGCDLIIGKPGMLKLGLGIDAKTGCICNVNRVMRK